MPAPQDAPLTPVKKRGMGAPFLIGLILVGFVVVVLIVVSRRSSSSAPAVEKPLPMGAAEQAYAPRIHFQDLQMSRAANFLNQEVTFLFGTASNEGDRSVHEIEVTIEFRDQFNQVVLRDTRRVLGARTAPLGPAQRREFQVSFEYVPDDWNRQYPSIRVTGLLLP